MIINWSSILILDALPALPVALGKSLNFSVSYSCNKNYNNTELIGYLFAILKIVSYSLFLFIPMEYSKWMNLWLCNLEKSEQFLRSYLM